MKSSSNNNAFTLLEMSIVLVIIGLVLGGGVTGFVKHLQKKGYQNTQERLVQLQDALLDYRQAFGRLPCPGDITDAQTDPNFGIESGEAGVCDTDNFVSGESVAGLLPVRALGLRDDMAFDAWGSRLLYAIDRRFTVNNAFSINQMDVTGNLLLGAPGAASTESALYVLVSHGSNRHGAYPRAGGAIRVSGRDPSATESGDDNWLGEMENCDCDDGTAASVTFDNEFSYGPFAQDPSEPNDTFDDLVVFKKREQM